MLGAGLALLAACGRAIAPASSSLLNVSYDATRELYAAINAAFVADYAHAHAHAKHVAIEMSHGGSGRQARAVIDGLRADVVTLATPYDVDQIGASGLLDKSWRTRLANNSSPYASTVVFVVRAGNPKAIHDWSDVARPGVSVVTPNPKTSGGARWNYLAAWVYALRQPGATEASAKDFVRHIYANAQVLDTGARAALTTFAQRGVGDVLIAWENEAHLGVVDFSSEHFEIVYPSLSIAAEPVAARVDANCARKGSQALADAYLQFLYQPAAQDIAARNFFRPADPAALARHRALFPTLPMVRVEDVFGSWAEAQRVHFAAGGVFDQVTAGRAP
jgi:sulfate transport system substrate-binding protein